MIFDNVYKLKKYISYLVSMQDETSNEGLVVDVDGPVATPGADARQPRGGSQFGEPPKVARLGPHFAFGVGTNARMRQSVRGASKRGRPRGSRRGGPIGGKGRGLLLPHPSSKASNSIGAQSPSSVSPTGVLGSSNEQALQHGKYPFLLRTIAVSFHHSLLEIFVDTNVNRYQVIKNGVCK